MLKLGQVKAKARYFLIDFQNIIKAVLFILLILALIVQVCVKPLFLEMSKFILWIVYIFYDGSVLS